MTPNRLGWLVAAVILVLDQATKRWVLDILDLAEKGRVAVAPFLDLVLVWNRGISYGLFQQEGPWGAWILVAVAVAASIFCAVWLRRADSRVVAVALGLIIGGAIGNGIDRALYGAVVDFVSLHHAGFYWYVFNVADTAIVAAVALLLYDSFRPRRTLAEK